MNNKRGGLRIEPLHYKDFIFETAYGNGKALDVVPLGRSIEGIPVTYQGDENTCVSCSFTWVKQWMEKNHPDLSHEWLAEVSGTSFLGASMRQVAEAARKTGICTQDAWNVDEPYETKLFIAANHALDGYFFVKDLSIKTLYKALREVPVILGLSDWGGVGPHAVVAFDVTEDGNLKCVNWWKADVQDVIEVDPSLIVQAVVPIPLPGEFRKGDVRLGIPAWACIKIKKFFNL